jgi:hypothetical protein
VFDFELIFNLKEAELAAAGRALGPIGFSKRQNAIRMSTYDNEKAPNTAIKNAATMMMNI